MSGPNSTCEYDQDVLEDSQLEVDARNEMDTRGVESVQAGRMEAHARVREAAPELLQHEKAWVEEFFNKYPAMANAT